MTIKSILFDMDGVLIDAKDWHYDALNRALSHFGFSISRESHLSTFDGLPTREKLKILSSARGLPYGLHDFINSLKQSYSLEIIYQRCKPTFNHQFALSNLKETGYKLGVCTNSVRKTTAAMLSLSLLDQFLDLVITNEDVSHSKPDPQIYINAMKYFGLEPHECLIIEDNDHGINAATAAGGHLLKVNSPEDVNIYAIRKRILEIQAG